MDTRVGRRASRAHSESADFAEADLLPTLTELMLALPMRIVRAFISVLQPGSSQPGRDGLDVSPMSGEWLHQLEVESEKHRED